MQKNAKKMQKIQFKFFLMTYILEVTLLTCSHSCLIGDNSTGNTDIVVVHDSEESKIFIGGNPKPPGRLSIFGCNKQAVEVNTD